MADEPKVLDGVEPGETEEVQEAPKPRTVEDLAFELGWKSKDQWKGADDGWQPAEDFLRAPREKRDNVTRELRSVRDQLDRVTRTSSQILADKLGEKDAQLAAMQARAVEEGDNKEVNRIVSERIKLKDNAPEESPLPPETAAFMEDNKDWFGKDRLATAHAKRIAAELAQDGATPAEQLREALRSVKKNFPELFPKAKEPPSVDTSRSRAAATSRGQGFADMPADSQKMAVDYEKRHGIKREDFAKSYFADLAKQRRA
jgi:hypothetical protein